MKHKGCKNYRRVPVSLVKVSAITNYSTLSPSNWHLTSMKKSFYYFAIFLLIRIFAVGKSSGGCCHVTWL